MGEVLLHSIWSLGVEDGPLFPVTTGIFTLWRYNCFTICKMPFGLFFFFTGMWSWGEALWVEDSLLRLKDFILVTLFIFSILVVESWDISLPFLVGEAACELLGDLNWKFSRGSELWSRLVVCFSDGESKGWALLYSQNSHTHSGTDESDCKRASSSNFCDDLYYFNFICDVI